MAIQRCYRATCDCCGHTQVIANLPSVGSRSYAERRLRRRGWKLGKRHRCRICAGASKTLEPASTHRDNPELFAILQQSDNDRWHG